MEESKCHSYLQEGVIRGSGELHTCQPHFDPWKVMEQRILEAISKYMKDKNLFGSSWHGFTKGKSCPSNLIVSYNEMTSLVHERRAVDLVYLDSVSHSILMTF